MPAPAQPHARNTYAHADERTPHRGIFPASRNSIAMKPDPISFSTDNSNRHRDYQNAKVAKHNKVSHQPHINIPFASGRSTNIKKMKFVNHTCVCCALGSSCSFRNLQFLFLFNIISIGLVVSVVRVDLDMYIMHIMRMMRIIARER